MNWEEAVKNGGLNVSPTYMKNEATCSKQAVLKTTQTNWSTVHTDYGNAYGAGAAELMRHHALESQDSRICAAILKTRHYMESWWDLKSPIHGKNLSSIVKGFYETDIYLQTLPDVKFHSSEHKIIAQVVDHLGRTLGWLSGTYDICFKDSLGRKVIKDFKAVTSLRPYSFPTDPQAPMYTLLNMLSDEVYGVDEEWSPASGYIVHVTKHIKPLEIVNTAMGHLANNIRPFMAKCLETAQTLYASSDMEAVDRLNMFGVNPYACELNAFSCEYNDLCAVSPSATSDFDNIIEDTRRPEKITHIKVTPDQVLQMADTLADLAYKEQELNKASVITQNGLSVADFDTDLNMSTIMKEDFGI